jgi:hypothetical protein
LFGTNALVGHLRIGARRFSCSNGKILPKTVAPIGASSTKLGLIVSQKQNIGLSGSRPAGRCAARMSRGLTATLVSLTWSAGFAVPALAFPGPDYGYGYGGYGGYGIYRGYGGYGGYGGYSPYSGDSAVREHATSPSRSRHRRSESSRGSDSEKPPAAKIAGPLMIDVSIGNQRVTVYDNGTPIASAPVSTGMKGHPTPLGVFSIIQKQRWHESNLYSNAPMPFMERITWSGVALHAGVLPGYPASHGCIRLPHEFAVRLYGMTRMGARVLVTRNEVTPVEIQHPTLELLSKAPDVASVDSSAVPPLSGGTGFDRLAAADVPVSAGTPATLLPPSAANSHDQSTGANVPLQPAADTKPSELPTGDGTSSESPVPIPENKPSDAGLRRGPISLFISRKEGRLFVRKGFAPLFDVPVEIADRSEPMGTHVFTAGPDGSGGLRWLAVSIPENTAASHVHAKSRHARDNRDDDLPATSANERSQESATAALSRIMLPPEALEQITPLVGAGASLIISDQGISGETGKDDTDFVVLTH